MQYFNYPNTRGGSKTEILQREKKKGIRGMPRGDPNIIPGEEKKGNYKLPVSSTSTKRRNYLSSDSRGGKRRGGRLSLS